MPILVLKEISCKHEHLRLACVRCEANNRLNIAGLQQTFDTLDFLICHRVNLSSELKLALSFNKFGHSQQNFLSLLLLLWVLVSHRYQLCDHLFLQGHIVLFSDGKCFVKLV